MGGDACEISGRLEIKSWNLKSWFTAQNRPAMRSFRENGTKEKFPVSLQQSGPETGSVWSWNVDKMLRR